MLALQTIRSPRIRSSVVPFASAPKPKYTTFKDLSRSRQRSPSQLRPLPRTVVGRFTTEVENFHGRIAMIGLTGCALDENLKQLPILQQITTETGIPSIQIIAFVSVITAAFILETFNPVVVRTEETELEVFTNPGFTLETEILHGRMAMLAFAYALLSEQLYSQLVL